METIRKIMLKDPSNAKEHYALTGIMYVTSMLYKIDWRYGVEGVTFRCNDEIFCEVLSKCDRCKLNYYTE